MFQAIWSALAKPRTVWPWLVRLGRLYAWLIIALLTLAATAMTLAFLAAMLGI